MAEENSQQHPSDLVGVPNVNLAQVADPALPETERRRIYAELARACEDHGFFFLSGHGQDELIAAVFDQARRFFAQPPDEKREVMRDATNPLGYFDRELTKQRRDLKEVFDFKAGGHLSRDPAKRTRWPQQPTGFEVTLTDFFVAFTALAEDTMALIFAALGMPDDAVAQTMAASFGERHSSAARLNFYPPGDPVPPEERDDVTALGDMALHHHTDPGAVTLLLQDDHGGLQARSKRHGWIDITPQRGTIVVNVGDMLQVWTNDRCVAGMHRVVPVPLESEGRYSVPFFYQPRIDAMIEPWTDGGELPRYSQFAWRDYIHGRVSDNFADYGEEDIQIERYRVR